MARVPDVLLTCCGEEEDEAEAPWRNEVSFYDSAHCWEPFSSTLKTASPEATAALWPDPELSRWRGPCQGGRPFADADLVETLLHSNLVEDSASFARTAFVSGRVGAVEYRSDPPPKTSTIQDVDHKSLFLGRVQNKDCLFAGHVEAVNSEKLVLHFYSSLDSKARHTKLVALGVGSKFYLSCRQKGGLPQLQLEKAETSLNPTLGKDMARLLFKLKGSSSSSNHVSFESVAHPGWFLATANSDNQPVRLHNLIGQDFYTQFYLPELQASSRW